MKKGRLLKLLEKTWEAGAEKCAPHGVDCERAKSNPNDFFAKKEEEARLFIRDIVEKWGLEPEGKRMLDIGCSFGGQTRGFSKMFGEVYAVDISSSMLATAQQLNWDLKNVKFIKTNGQDLKDLPDNYFDFVFSCGVFHHLPEDWIISGYFQEISRVLKIGGLFKIQLAERELHPAFWSFAFGFIPVPSFIAWRLPFTVTSLHGYLLSILKGRGCNPTRTTISPAATTKLLSNNGLSALDVFEQEFAQKFMQTWCVGQKNPELQ